jgi:hypothetical protein
MLGFMKNKVSDRKYYWFACVCCRRGRHLLTDHRSRDAVATVEQYLTMLTPPRELKRALKEAEAACEEFVGADDLDPAAMAATVAHDIAWALVQGDVRGDFIGGLADTMARAIAADEAPNATHEQWQSFFQQEVRSQVAILRDVLGPAPFRPVSIHPAWLTPKVRSLAAAMHDTGNFEDMPLLAAALEEAGCRDGEKLGHCRVRGHVRGCWIVDLIVQVGGDDD